MAYDANRVTPEVRDPVAVSWIHRYASLGRSGRKTHLSWIASDETSENRLVTSELSPPLRQPPSFRRVSHREHTWRLCEAIPLARRLLAVYRLLADWLAN